MADFCMECLLCFGVVFFCFRNYFCGLFAIHNDSSVCNIRNCTLQYVFSLCIHPLRSVFARHPLDSQGSNDIGLDKSGYQVNIFLFSPRKHVMGTQ